MLVSKLVALATDQPAIKVQREAALGENGSAKLLAKIFRFMRMAYGVRAPRSGISVIRPKYTAFQSDLTLLQPGVLHIRASTTG